MGKILVNYGVKIFYGVGKILLFIGKELMLCLSLRI